MAEWIQMPGGSGGERPPMGSYQDGYNAGYQAGHIDGGLELENEIRVKPNGTIYANPWIEEIKAAVKKHFIDTRLYMKEVGAALNDPTNEIVKSYRESRQKLLDLIKE